MTKEKNNTVELAKEAVKLIKEFAKEASEVWECPYESIRKNTAGTKIIIMDSYDGKKEINLNEISNVFEEQIDGDALYGSPFSEGIEEIKTGIVDKINILSKKDFIKQIGEINYTEARCQSIYERLKEIENEVYKK